MVKLKMSGTLRSLFDWATAKAAASVTISATPLVVFFIEPPRFVGVYYTGHYRAMPFIDLQDFLRYLERHGQLKRVRAEVDPELEVTEITQRVLQEQGPALLFERPKV